MLLHDIAESYKIFPHVFEVASVDDRSWRLRSLPCFEHLLGHFALFLQDGEPAHIEFFPELEAFGMFFFVVSN